MGVRVFRNCIFPCRVENGILRYNLADMKIEYPLAILPKKLVFDKECEFPMPDSSAFTIANESYSIIGRAYQRSTLINNKNVFITALPNYVGYCPEYEVSIIGYREVNNKEEAITAVYLSGATILEIGGTDMYVVYNRGENDNILKISEHYTTKQACRFAIRDNKLMRVIGNNYTSIVGTMYKGGSIFE